MTSRFDGKLITAIQIKKGVPYVINAQTVTVWDRDGAQNVLYGKVAGVPSDGGAGYAVGAEIMNSTNGAVYRNVGTTAASVFELVGTVGAGTITAAEIATDAVDSAEIKANAVGADEIAAGAVDTSELAADAVEGTKIADDAVDSEHLAADAVEAEHIANDIIGPDQLADGAVEWVSVDITAAEVKALAATPKQLVAAPGADKILEFISASLVLDYGSEVLAEDGGGSNLGIKYENAAGVQASEDIESTGFIDQAADTFTRTTAKKDTIVAAAGCVNKALVLDNIGAGEITGNATNDTVLTVKVAYRVLAAGF